MIMVNVPTKMTGLTVNVMTISLATAAAVRNPISDYMQRYPKWTKKRIIPQIYFYLFQN